MRQWLPAALLLAASACSDTDSAGDPSPSSAGGSGGSSAGSGGSSGGSTGGKSGGGTAGVAGSGGEAGTSTAGTAGAAGSAGGCQQASDCALPETNPIGCAEAACEGGVCVFRAKDKDGDGKRAKLCKDSAGEASVETGNDCDDTDPNRHPGAWDGPEGEGNASACDGIDNDCSGTADDSVLSDGTSCTCKPGAVAACSEDSSGKAIVWPTGAPVGECKTGSKTCVADAVTGLGTWGPCTGAAGPAQEECNGGKDDDCDGLADDADSDVSNPKKWFCDGDNDNFAPVGAQAVVSCEVPTKACEGASGSWKLDIPATDCDDARADVHPNGVEVCDGGPTDPDGKADDENCDGLPNQGPGVVCTCKAGQTQSCFVDPNGQLIPQKDGVAIGACKAGTQACAAGSWGPCLEGKGPEAETCLNEGVDNDCDGLVKEANGAQQWFWDADDDGHADPLIKPVTACNKPTQPPEDCEETKGKSTCVPASIDTAWKTAIVADDCNDTNPKVNPKQDEVCDGVRNDCQPLPPDDKALNQPTWYRDADKDKHAVIGPGVQQCANPGKEAFNCVGAAPCEDQWTTDPISKEDCDDLDKTTYPGAWDGPAVASRPYGIVPPGLTAELFSYSGAPDFTNAFSQPPVSTTTHVTINYDWVVSSPDPKVGVDSFAYRWKGKLEVPQSGTYKFSGAVDDLVRLTIDGKVVGSQGLGAISQSATLTKGEHTFQVDYIEASYTAYLRLWWEGPGVPKQVLTVKQTPTTEQQVNRCGDDRNNDCAGAKDDGHFKQGVGGLDLSCKMDCEPASPDMSKYANRACPGGLGQGICRTGSQTCKPDGTWSDCAGRIDPQPTEMCNGDGKDYNCNGVANTVQPNGDCNCTNGATQPCTSYKNDGAPWCGIATCQNNQWNVAACTQPPRNCGSSNDNNCDGKPDDIVDLDYCKCKVGEVKACNTHPGKDGVGICKAGVQSCKSEGGKSDWGPCIGNVDPKPEECQPDLDLDCNGLVGDSPGCHRPVWMLTPNAWPNTCSPLPSEAVVSGSATSDPGYEYYALMWAWGAPGSSGIPVKRCVCWDAGFHTASIGPTCPYYGGPCVDLGTIGYVRNTPPPGQHGQVYEIDLPGDPKAYCSHNGCNFYSCLPKFTVQYYSPSGQLRVRGGPSPRRPSAATSGALDWPSSTMDAQSFYRRPLPGGLVAFSSPEGRAVFAEALAEGHLEGYFALAEQFHTQSEPAFCGLGTLVMSLNALGVDPGRLWKGPWRWYSEEMLDCCAPLEVVRQGGITLDQFACLARCNGASAEVHRASERGIDAFRQQVRAAARSAGAPVLAAAYTRKALGQTGDGHFSPLAGYHAASDRVLLLDVARFKYPPHWVPLPQLWESMLAVDPSTGRSRGYVVLHRSAAPAALYYRLTLGRCSWGELSRQLFEALPAALERAAPATAAEAVRVAASQLSPSACAAGAGTFDEAIGALEPEHRAQVDELRSALRSSALFGLVREAGGPACCADGHGPEAFAALLLAVTPWLLPSLPPGARSELSALSRPSSLGAPLGAEIERLRAQIEALHQTPLPLAAS